KPPEAADQLGARMQELLAHVRHLSSSVHDLSHQLHPSKLEQLGLVAAIGGLCRELTHHHGLKIEFTHDQMPAAISPDTALCLYRIAQEGLQNAIKHSGAQQAEVALNGGCGCDLLGDRGSRAWVRPPAAPRQEWARARQHARASAFSRRRDRDRLTA